MSRQRKEAAFSKQWGEMNSTKFFSFFLSNFTFNFVVNKSFQMIENFGHLEGVNSQPDNRISSLSSPKSKTSRTILT